MKALHTTLMFLNILPSFRGSIEMLLFFKLSLAYITPLLFLFFYRFMLFLNHSFESVDVDQAEASLHLAMAVKLAVWVLWDAVCKNLACVTWTKDIHYILVTEQMLSSRATYSSEWIHFQLVSYGNWTHNFGVARVTQLSTETHSFTNWAIIRNMN